MSIDLANRLSELAELLAEGDITEAAYQRRLEKLRAQYGSEAVDAVLESTAPPSGRDYIDARGAQGFINKPTGSVTQYYGSVYLFGERRKQATDLIGAYLQRQTQRCGSLPLQGVYQQKASDDVLAISLEQVYTQLAIQGLTVREEYAGEALASFDAAAYLEQHRGAHLLPAQQREWFHPIGASSQNEFGRPIGRSLSMLDAADLTRLAQESERLSFLGPQLVTEAITQHQHLVLLGEPGSGKVRRMTARVITRNALQVGAMTCEVDRLTGRGNTYGNTACR
jgi:hypothetical protein